MRRRHGGAVDRDGYPCLQLMRICLMNDMKYIQDYCRLPEQCRHLPFSLGLNIC